MKKKIIIDGKETNYSVTDDAHIYNDKTGRELKGTYATNDYHSIQLVIDGKPKTFMFHRLVAQAFCENPNNYTIVDHIDRNKHNDNASNLRWVDASTNAKNCERTTPAVKREKYLGDFTEKKWYPVYGFEDFYKVSEDCEFVKLQTLQILTLTERHGYLRVSLGGVQYSAHIKLWESVNKQAIPDGYNIDHIDGNKANNCINNLRATTYSDNMKNAYKNGHRRQVAIKQYSLQGEYLNTYSSIREASRNNNISEVAIKDASNRYGISGGFYWIREDDPISIEEAMNSWVPEGFTIIPEYPTYCINKEGQVYNKRNKNKVPIHYRANGKDPYIILNSKRVNIADLMP